MPTMRSDLRQRQRQLRVAAACAAAAALVTHAGAFAADESSALEAMLVRDSETTLQLRSYWLNRHKPGPEQNAAWAAGGWLGYRSGWLGDALSFGLTGYTSQRLWGPPDAAGSLLLAPEQKGYSVLGQIYVSLKLVDQTLTGGRFEVNQPEVNPQDNRMTPNTFEGGKLGGNLGGVNYLAAYLTAEKTRNSTAFVDMATVAGAPSGVSSDLWLVGFAGEPAKDLALRLSSFHVPDVLNSTFADVNWLAPLTESLKLRLGAQAMVQGSTGSNALTGASFSTKAGGLKADLVSGGATATLAYTQTGRGAAYRAPYGSWAGYTSMIARDFDQAGEKAWLIGGSYDFAGLDAPGMVLNGAVVVGRGAVNATTGAALANQTEYDLTLDYRFTAKGWPPSLRPLWIRARAAYVTPSAGANTTDYRIIVNYPMVFK
jgi:outer membrane porin, OprD family